MSKTAVVLSGGGAKGAFQVGALKKLAEQGFTFDAIYGTSVGALNAAAIAYKGVKYTEEQWLTIKGRGDVLSFNWLTLLGLSSGVYNLNPLKEYLEATVQGTPTSEAVVCKCDLVSGEVMYAKSGEPDFIKSVLQSATIPFVMEPIDNMADGGIREQTPLKKAIDDGADKIVVILCNPFNPDGVTPPSSAFEQPTGFFKMVKYGYRAVDLLEHDVFVNDLKRAIKYNANPAEYKVIDLTIISPDKLLIDTLEFDATKIRAALQQGYDAVK